MSCACGTQDTRYGLLRDLRPDLNPAEARKVARDLAEGWALLVLEDDFQPLDARSEEWDDIDPLDPDPPSPPPPSPLPPAPQKLTFIGLRVVDADGKAVPHLKYRLTLPGGAAVDGQLNGEGIAHHDGLDPGACYVVFEKRALGGPAPASPTPPPHEPGSEATYDEAPDDPLDDGELGPVVGPIPPTVDEHEEVDEDGVPFDEE